MDLNTTPNYKVSIGEKVEKEGGKSYPKPLNYFTFKKIVDRQGREGYPPVPKTILDVFTPVEGRGRVQPKNIRMTFAASEADQIMYTMVGEYMARGVKWKAVDPYSVQWKNDGEPIIDEVFERQSDGTMEIVRFDPSKHLASWRERRFNLRSTSVYGYLEVLVGEEWVADPTNGFWKLVFGSEQSTQSTVKAFQSMRAQAMVDTLVEASDKDIKELGDMSIAEISQFKNIIGCHSLMGKKLEFFINSGISKDGRKYSFISAKTDLHPESLALIAKIDVAQKLAIADPGHQLEGGTQPKAIASKPSVITAEVTPESKEEDYYF